MLYVHSNLQLNVM